MSRLVREANKRGMQKSKPRKMKALQMTPNIGVEQASKNSTTSAADVQIPTAMGGCEASKLKNIVKDKTV